MAKSNVTATVNSNLTNGTELTVDERIINLRNSLALQKLKLKELRKEKLAQRLQVELDQVETQLAQESQVSLNDIRDVDMPQVTDHHDHARDEDFVKNTW